MGEHHLTEKSELHKNITGPTKVNYPKTPPDRHNSYHNVSFWVSSRSHEVFFSDTNPEFPF